MSGSSTRRPTRQQAAVAALLERSSDFTSAQTLHARLRESGDPIGLATVYRALQSMVEAGTVDVLRTDDGEAVYRACSTHHHHHLVCRSCGRTVEVEGPAVESWADRVAGEHGFSDVTHTLEIFGTCAACATTST
ncbi:peptide ABC transporter substrate-binding protein [Intrasporangium oryzae NRRL B-24470]|uniref:Peptide ABC transporter substrate-binding protein n=1 Tax=Intrasporangium oryzae NRRL B-24470 TaxID=1386089 RepID=W9GB44_9MICO|nr:Fur family transcriptional regulator [Intrasporangium oryzae]EWT03426.1 peptide ABC transporter substrate-binding protein [Intrasporangium oryzae NRRL B-24470]